MDVPCECFGKFVTKLTLRTARRWFWSSASEWPRICRTGALRVECGLDVLVHPLVEGVVGAVVVLAELPDVLPPCCPLHEGGGALVAPPHGLQEGLVVGEEVLSMKKRSGRLLDG